MSKFLKRYFLIILLLLFLAGMLTVSYTNETGRFHSSGIFWIIAAIVVLPVVIVRRFKNIYPRNPRGEWTGPGKNILLHYLVTFLIAALADVIPKLFLFNESGIKNEILSGFGTESFFNPDPFSQKIAVVMAFFTWLFLVGGLFFRFNVPCFNRAWVFLSSMAFSSSLLLTVERIIFNGVHDIFYFEQRFRYLCPSCGLKYPYYIWCPADMFINWSILFLMILYPLSIIKNFVTTKLYE
jgi:hypothetical protein